VIIVECGIDMSFWFRLEYTSPTGQKK